MKDYKGVGGVAAARLVPLSPGSVGKAFDSVLSLMIRGWRAYMAGNPFLNRNFLRRCGCTMVNVSEIVQEFSDPAPDMISEHSEKWQQIATIKVSCLFNPTQRGEPSSRRERAFLEIFYRGENILVLHQPSAPFTDRCWDGRSSDHVTVHDADNVVVVHVHEQAKCGAHAGVDVKHLVLPVARIILIVDINNAAVTDFFCKTLCHCADSGVAYAYPERSHSCMDRVLADLSPGERAEAV